MARKWPLPGQEALTTAADFVRGALSAGRHPAHPGPVPAGRPEGAASRAPEEEGALPKPAEPKEGSGLDAEDAALSMTAADEGGAAQEQPGAGAASTFPGEAVAGESAVVVEPEADDEAAAADGEPSVPTEERSATDEPSAPTNEPAVGDEASGPPPRSTTPLRRRGLRRPLLAAGGACLIVGAVAIVIATAAGGGDSTTPGVASDTSTTGFSAPVTLPAIAKGTEPTATPGATGTTVRGQAARDTTSTKSTTETVGPSTTLGNAATRERVRSLARGAGFTVFALEDPTWQLDQLTFGQTASHGYMAMVYRKGSQYMSVSQEPRAQSAEVPNAQKVVIDGQPGELVDMGSVVLLSWRDRGTAITLSTDVPRAEALALAAKFTAVN